MKLPTAQEMERAESDPTIEMLEFRLQHNGEPLPMLPLEDMVEMNKQHRLFKKNETSGNNIHGGFFISSTGVDFLRIQNLDIAYY